MSNLFTSCYVASTHDQRVFSFYPDHRPCDGFEDVLRRYREIVPHLKLSGFGKFLYHNNNLFIVTQFWNQHGASNWLCLSLFRRSNLIFSNSWCSNDWFTNSSNTCEEYWVSIEDLLLQQPWEPDCVLSRYYQFKITLLLWVLKLWHVCCPWLIVHNFTWV